MTTSHMKALFVEDILEWNFEIEKALTAALTFIKAGDINGTDTPARALKFLKGDDGWKYRLVFLDWGFVNLGIPATAIDVATFIRDQRPDIYLVIISGADKDEEFLKKGKMDGA